MVYKIYKDSLKCRHIAGMKDETMPMQLSNHKLKYEKDTLSKWEKRKSNYTKRRKRKVTLCQGVKR